MEKKLSDVDVFKIYKKWDIGTGLFRSFFRKTNFVSLKHYPDFNLTKPSHEPDYMGYIVGLIQERLDNDTLFLIDLPGEEAISVAKIIEKRLMVKPILTFNNVLHPHGLIGSKQYVSNLLDYCGIEERNFEVKGFAFISDYMRYGDYSDEQLKKNFNNQYELTEDDLPSIEMLKELGYKRVVFLCMNDLKEDMTNYLDYLVDGDVEVEKLNVFQPS